MKSKIARFIESSYSFYNSIKHSSILNLLFSSKLFCNEYIAKIIKSVFEEFNAPLINTVYDDPRTLHIYENTKQTNAGYYILEKDNKVVVGCGYYPTEGLPEGMCELVKFYLSPETRHKGQGTKLFEKVLKEAKNAGYNKIYIESFPQFSKAVSIYEKKGFIKIDNPIGNSGHTATSLWYIKEL